MNNSTHLDKAQQILQQLRDSFLDELPERCNAIEGCILALNSDDHDEQYGRLYRNVHSLKGSAGTHGIAAISSICHQLEDYLNDAQTRSQHSNERITIYLQYLDLIRRCVDIAHTTRPHYGEIDQVLEQLRQQRSPNKLLGLVVENSRAMSGMYVDGLANLPVELALMQDGLEALGRLLHEKFDFVIMGSETRTLNGTALLYALRAANGINRHIKVIMVTANDKQQFAANLQPDTLVSKGPTMLPSLHDAVARLLQDAEK